MKKVTKALSLVFSLVMVLGILTFNTINVKAAGGIDDFVTRCYRVAFGRTPDEGGFDYWKRELTEGRRTGSNIVDYFMFCEEYVNQDRSDDEFVFDAYTMFMGREPDTAGYDFWTGKMREGMTRKDIVAGFANSDEFYELCNGYGITAGYFSLDYSGDQLNKVNLFVERLYKTTLGRLGDKGGQIYWTESLLRGEQTGISCAKNFIKSPEYEGLGLTYSQYVENLYLGLMGRPYDEDGRDAWHNQLKYGTLTKDQVFAGFANSEEFRLICESYGINPGSYTATDIATAGVTRTETETYSDGSYKEYRHSGVGNTIITVFSASGIKELEIVVESGQEKKRIIYDADGSVDHSEKTEYDSNGNEIKVTVFDADGSVIRTKGSEYDANGNLTKSIMLGADGTIIQSIENEYYANGKKKKTTAINPDGRKNICIYDENGNEIKVIVYNPEGEYYWSDKEYDENGKIKHYLEYNCDGSKDLEDFYTDGLLKESFEYNRDGSIRSHYEHEYNLSENTWKRIELKSDGSKKAEVRDIETEKLLKDIEYNTSGIVTEENEWDDGRRIKHSDFDSDGIKQKTEEYDSESRTTKEIRYNGDGSIDSWYAYEYNEYGNKIKEVYYSGDGTMLSCEEYVLDGDTDTKKKCTYTFSDNSKNIEEYQDGKKVKKTNYDSNGIKTTMYEYDTEGISIIRTTYYLPDGTVDRVE